MVPVAWRWDGVGCRLVDLLQMCNAVVCCASLGAGDGKAYDAGVNYARMAFDVVVVMIEDWMWRSGRVRMLWSRAEKSRARLQICTAKV